MGIAERLRWAMGWAACNLKLLAIRAFAITVSAVPCRTVVLNLAGVLTGLVLLVARAWQWKGIEAFRRQNGSPHGRASYILSYCMQQGINRMWGTAYPEAAEALEADVKLAGGAWLSDALREGRGVILVASHCGPPVIMPALHYHHFDPWFLAGDATIEQVRTVSEFAIRGLLTRRVSIAGRPSRLQRASLSERGLIRHLREGGLVGMYLDTNLPVRKGMRPEFFGLPTGFSIFPFKASLRFGSPVLYAYIERAAAGGFRLNLVRAEPFSTPEEGLQTYARFLEAVIRRNPFMWAAVPDHMGRVDEIS